MQVPPDRPQSAVADPRTAGHGRRVTQASVLVRRLARGEPATGESVGLDDGLGRGLRKVQKFALAASAIFFVNGLARQIMRWEGMMMLLFFCFFI